MEWNWVSFFVGVLVGWLIEWLIDYFYWRRKYSEMVGLQARAEQVDALKADLTASRAQVDTLNLASTTSKAEIDKLQADLSSARDEIIRLEAVLAAATRVAGDDLTMIEGIGPKIADLLNQQDILTFDELGKAHPDQLHEILKAGGPGFQMADPTTWPRQARLAAKRDWVELQLLKEELTGGVRRPTAEEPQADDDLTQIEGIGPQIDALLKSQGIRTFEQLAEADPEWLQTTLNEAGPGFQMAATESWPEQARLAADQEWDELRILQEQLTAGREDA